MAIEECGRVLKPDGYMIVFTTLQTELMESKEGARIYDSLGIVPENLVQAFVEDSFRNAGLQSCFTESIGSELMQYYEERDGRCARELMRLARMISDKEKFMAELGKSNYEVTLALYNWVIYQLLGKLSSSIYTLRKKHLAEAFWFPKPVSKEPILIEN